MISVNETLIASMTGRYMPQCVAVFPDVYILKNMLKDVAVIEEEERCINQALAGM
jgi:hypothetical protein